MKKVAGSMTPRERQALREQLPVATGSGELKSEHEYVNGVCLHCRQFESEATPPASQPTVTLDSLGFRHVHAVKDDFHILIPLDRAEQDTYGVVTISPRAWNALLTLLQAAKQNK